MTKRGRPRKIVSIIPEPAYKVKLEANNTSYQASGASLLEAVSALPVGWMEIKTKGNLIIDFGSKHLERFYSLMPLRRLINSKLRKQGQVGQLEKLL